MFNRHSRGIGLLELMLSIAIIALVIIMATRYFSVTQQQQKLMQITRQVTDIIRAAQTWGAGQSSYAKIGIKELQEAGLLPGTGGTYKDPWGQTIEIFPSEGDTQIEIRVKSDSGLIPRDAIPLELCESVLKKSIESKQVVGQPGAVTLKCET